MHDRPHISTDPHAAISLREASVYLGCDYVYVLDMVYHPGRIESGRPILESIPKPGTRNRRVTTRALCEIYRTALQLMESSADGQPSASPHAGVSQTPASTAPGSRSRPSAPTSGTPQGWPALSPLKGAELLKSIGL